MLELCERLNPARIPGRLTLISRMGADHVEDALRAAACGPSATPATRWCGRATRCTPTPSPSVTGRKTRDFDDICAEIDGFVRAHRAEGTWPGGIHVELTGDNVTECIGGADKILDSQLDDRYQTVCDPRLNARQSLDLAFHVAELLRSHRPRLNHVVRGAAADRLVAGRRTSPPRVVRPDGSVDTIGDTDRRSASPRSPS